MLSPTYLYSFRYEGSNFSRSSEVDDLLDISCILLSIGAKKTPVRVWIYCMVNTTLVDAKAKKKKRGSKQTLILIYIFFWSNNFNLHFKLHTQLKYIIGPTGHCICMWIHTATKQIIFGPRDVYLLLPFFFR